MISHWLLSPLALAALTLPATAATLCASSAGSPGCYPTIAAAITAANPGDVINVGPGTYPEAVVITKPLSLNADRAIIDATGLPQAILVNGLAAPGLSAVHITGFTASNANFEGILVLNASDVTLGSNIVTHNNLALTPDGHCPTRPVFEPGEDQDCGEGVHLQGADHTIVTANTITGNAGGILITDDTAASHDNLISFNLVRDNAFACGITMASHVPSPTAPFTAPPGVFHNTIYGNKSMHNGYSVGGGSGIGIFASIPGAAAYGNVVVNNYVSENGHGGIDLHAHAPQQILNDNMIVGNTAVNNGADTADAHTPGPVGINLYSLIPVPGNIISGNTFAGDANDVGISNPALVQVQFNSFHAPVGIVNQGTGPVDATSNWWSCPTGPSTLNGCASASGPNIISAPWLLQATPQQPSY